MKPMNMETLTNFLCEVVRTWYDEEYVDVTNIDGGVSFTVEGSEPINEADKEQIKTICKSVGYNSDIAASFQAGYRSTVKLVILFSQNEE